MTLDIHELDDPDSDVARQTLALCEAAFPIEERDDIAVLAEAIRRQATGPTPQDHIRHFWAAVQDDTVYGVAIFSYYADTRLAFVAYIAIRADARGQGLGAWLFQRLVTQVARDAAALGGAPALGLCWEVERPQDAAAAEERRIRERRIRFYQRLGAHLIEQIDFIAPPLRPGLPAVPYHLMFRALNGEATPTRALLQAIIETVLGDDYGLAHNAPSMQRALASLEAHGP